ncbi:MAG: TonB-dependent receptor [Balneolaceae bacterium]|nr:TonB-dependent receptor [Balneolaceae bacterium]
MNILKHSIFWSIFFAIHSGLYAQQFSIEGVVSTKQGQPISEATIYVSQSVWAISDAEGQFQLQDLDSGEYPIVVSRVGYQSKELTVQIPLPADSEFEIILDEKIYDNNPVVVTANRTSKMLQDVSVPVSVVNQNEIEASGSLRLSDILDEQIGLNIVSDHGTGIQVQGFDPEYTLILIDNQPVIGRTAGTLDLTRLSVGNIEQIEIVKGPSSALWGSNALAGVINIITEKGSKPFTLDVNGRYGSHSTYDAGLNGTFKKDRLRGRFFGNYNGSSGYDLNDKTVAPTIPEYENITLSGGVNYRINSNLDFGISTRYYSEDQFYNDEISNGNSTDAIVGEDLQTDFSLSPELNFYLGNKFLLETNAFLSTFESKSESIFTESGEIYFSDSFSQTLNKYESKASAFWNSDHSTIAGIGMNREDLTAEIYADVPGFNSYFMFGQHEWQASEKLSLIGGFRFDAHSEYRSQLSPKFSALYKANDKIQFRASFGGGFKAPDFRQLFLNFTNPIAGYSVFGTSTVVEGIERLEEDGQIEELYFSPSEITDIRAEESFAINAGSDLFVNDDIQINFNAFRNSINDLIETQRIALKTNGQSVFSYFNLNKVYTQGLETELKFQPSYFNGLRISLGYQYLDARRQITRTFDRVENGVVVTKTEQVYIPLYNRSKHTFNAKLYQYFEKSGIETGLRFMLRGKYWFFDYNDNGIDEESEYVLNDDNPFQNTIVNYSISKTFAERYKVQFGINNLFDFQDEIVLPSNPGRTFYTQININIF